jgi:hypothetical protein
LAAQYARGRAMRARKVARIFMHDASLFANCQKVGKGYGVLLVMSFSFFFPKTWMGKRYGILLEMLVHYKKSVNP